MHTHTHTLAYDLFCSGVGYCVISVFRVKMSFLCLCVPAICCVCEFGGAVG